MSQKPSVGRIVHYVSHGTPFRRDGTQAFRPECRAAIVTEVDPDDPTRIGLTAINPTGMFFHPLAVGGCVQDELPPADKIAPGERTAHNGGTWHWPERVDAS